MTATAGFDIGTSSVKVLIVSPEGKTLGFASSPVSVRPAQSGHLEEEPEDWWRGLVSALGKARAGLPRGTEIAAIGLSGHMSGLVVLDKDLEPLMPCLLLADTRGSEEAANLPSRVRARIIEQTGNCPSAAFSFAKLLWAREHRADVFSRAAWVVSAKDYILSRLTGNVSTEPTDAGNYLLLDKSAARWDDELIESLGLPQVFPQLRSSSEKAGELTGSAALDIGLAPGIPVVAGGADMACTAVGSGTLSKARAAMSLGTASPVIIPVSGIDAELVGKLTFHPHALPGSRYALASILSGGRSYQWLQRTLQEACASKVELEDMDRFASRSVPGAGGVLFLPFLTGTGSPDWRASGRAAWLGLGAATSMADLCRAILEGVAYNCRECLELYLARHGRLSGITVSGGGARSDLWAQILSDVTGLPVTTVQIREASALGACVLAAVGCGMFPSIADAVSAMVRLGESREPDARKYSLYSGLFDAYLLAKSSLAAVDDSLASARQREWPT